MFDANTILKADSVTTHSIRYRILKERRVSVNPSTQEVTTHSIRYRILKGRVNGNRRTR